MFATDVKKGCASSFQAINTEKKNYVNDEIVYRSTERIRGKDRTEFIESVLRGNLSKATNIIEKTV